MHHRLIRSLMPGLLGAVLLAGCATARPENQGLLEAEGARKLGYSVNWVQQLNVPEGGRITRARVLDDLIVMVQSPRNVVSAIEVRDGEVRWRTRIAEAGDQLFRPVRTGDRIVLNTANRLYSLDVDTGKLADVFRLPKVVSTGGALVNGTLVLGSVGGEVFGYRLDGQYRAWDYDLTGRIAARPVKAGANVFVADTRGIYAMLDASSGRRLWGGRVFGPVTARAAIGKQGVYVPGNDQALYALNRGSGVDLWKRHFAQPLILSPELMGGILYLPVPGEGLAAVGTVGEGADPAGEAGGNRAGDSARGTESGDSPEGEDSEGGAEAGGSMNAPRGGRTLWWVNALARPLARREGTGNVLLAQPGRDGSLMLVEIETGQVLSRVPTGQPLVSALNTPHESLVLISSRGRLLRLNRRP